MSGRIFHYTSIAALALILESRKLRFTRLDSVDDVKEAQVREGVPFGEYFFVSCWTLEDKESIPQWNMYSKNMEGVRISLPLYPFARKDISKPPPGFHVKGEAKHGSPFTWEEMSGPDYIIVPTFLRQDFFAGAVEYVDDLAARYSEDVQRSRSSDGREALHVANLPGLSRLKERDWEFQKEFRFSLFVVPVPALRTEADRVLAFLHRLDHVSESVRSGMHSTIEYIDVDLAAESFDDLVVRTGPRCGRGGRVCTAALLDKYAPKAKLEDSHLAGYVR